MFLKNEEWDLKQMTVRKIVEEFNYGAFPILNYEVFLKRKPFFYVCNLVVPTMILSITALIGFHMPSGGNGVHAEKVRRTI